MVPHMLLYDRDRTVDPLLGPVLLREDRPHHHMQTPQRLLDQGDTQLPHVPEVPVERGRGDPHHPRDLPQPQAAQALLLQQPERRVEQRLTGLLFLGLPDSKTVTHVIQ